MFERRLTAYFLISGLQGLLTALTYLCTFELHKRSNPVFYKDIDLVGVAA